VTNCRDWFEIVRESSDKLNRQRVGAKLIRIDNPTGQQKRIVIMGSAEFNSTSTWNFLPLLW
jgi:hypothetical protein